MTIRDRFPRVNATAATLVALVLVTLGFFDLPSEVVAGESLDNLLRQRGIRSWGHGGMAPGTPFEFKVYPDLGVVMVMLSNFDTIAGPEMATAIDDVVRNAGATGP